MFKRKQVVRVQPSIPSKMALENGAMGLLEQIRRDHEENIKLCSDLIVIKNWMEKAKAGVLKDAMEWADQYDFWLSKLNTMIGKLQSEAPQQEQEPVLSNGMAQLEGPASTTQAIGFLARRA